MTHHKIAREHKSEEDSQLQHEEENHLETHPLEPVESRPKSGPIVSFLVQFLVVAVLFFSMGFVLGKKGFEIERRGIIPTINVTNQASQVQNVDFSLFWKVFETLPQTYLDKSSVDGQKMMYG